MLHNDIDFEFFINPGRALLLLEVENLLESTPHEGSSLRRSSPDTKPLRIVWDTRKLKLTEDSSERVLFIARQTEKFDSHLHIEKLLNEGHIVIAQWDCLVAMHAQKGAPLNPTWMEQVISHPHLLCVKNTEFARNLLIQTASQLRSQEWTSLAITGTNGKTSTTQITSTMLEKLSQKDVLKIGTLGICVGSHAWDNPYPTQPDFPGLLAALRAAKTHFGCTQMVMEATSIGIAENRLGLWPIQCAAFLNLTQDHLDYHKTMENYLEAKLDLFRRHLDPSGQVIVNCDDASWQKAIRSAAGRSRFCVGFGKSYQKDNFFALTNSHFSGVRYLESSHQVTNLDGLKGQWTLWLDQQSCVGQAQYATSLLGEVQHENVSASAALMLSLGYPLNQIASVCHQLEAIPGRLERIVSVAGVPSVQHNREPAVLVDYAHTPDALEKTLKTCRSLLMPKGRLICVFGCGGDRDPTKRPIMGRLASELADHVWLTSDNPRTEEPNTIIRQIRDGIPSAQDSKITVQADRRAAIFEAIHNANTGDLVLIAGKGHEDYQIIGSTKYPFSDSGVARQALQSKRNI